MKIECVKQFECVDRFVASIVGASLGSSREIVGGSFCCTQGHVRFAGYTLALLYIVFGLDNRFTVGRSIEKHRMRNGPRRIGHQKGGCGLIK